MADEPSTAPTTDPAPPAPVAIFKKRGAKGKAANIRKRAATPPPQNSDSDSDFTSSEDESTGQRIKRRKKNNNTGVVTASSRDNKPSAPKENSTVIYEADRTVPITSTNDATKRTDWYDEDKNLLGKTRTLPSIDSSTADGTYKGLSHKTQFIPRNPNAPSRKVGPIKAAANIRTITTTDFAPDVCKDYKQTGFCGFGDNCKFLHAREDYKQGWQLDREWENVTKGKKSSSSTGKVVASANRDTKGGADGDDSDAADEALLEKIPFACIICKGPYKEPIVTRCGHYFCLPCALQRYRKEPSCAACGAGTNGVFNTAKTLNKLLEKKKRRQERKRQKAIEAGEEVPEEEEEEG